MFYHSRPLKYVACGKVTGSPCPDEFLAPAYRWLGQKCGYCPQVWLAKGSCEITGWRATYFSRKWLRRHRRMNDVLFGFDPVMGFPVAYGAWHFVLDLAEDFERGAGRQIASPADAKAFEAKLWAYLVDLDRDLALDGITSPKDTAREGAASMGEWLEKVLFVEKDQVVVPSLNLKAAKRVVCRDERTKAALRRMGFIEDRIQIRKAS